MGQAFGREARDEHPDRQAVTARVGPGRCSAAGGEPSTAPGASGFHVSFLTDLLAVARSSSTPSIDAANWDYLASDLELPRFGVVAGYCHRFADGGAILEFGCGEGLLARRLDSSRYRRVVGVDVSPAVVDRAELEPPPGASFVVADAEASDPGDRVLRRSRTGRAQLRAVAGHRWRVHRLPSSCRARTRAPVASGGCSGFYRCVARARVSTSDDLTWIVGVLSPPHR